MKTTIKIYKNHKLISNTSNLILNAGINYLTLCQLKSLQFYLSNDASSVQPSESGFATGDVRNITISSTSHDRAAAKYNHQSTGQISGRFSSIGMHAGGVKFSRALITDGTGTPITINVEAGDTLTINYSFIYNEGVFDNAFGSIKRCNYANYGLYSSSANTALCGFITANYDFNDVAKLNLPIYGEVVNYSVNNLADIGTSGATLALRNNLSTPQKITGVLIAANSAQYIMRPANALQIQPNQVLTTAGTFNFGN